MTDSAEAIKESFEETTDYGPLKDIHARILAHIDEIEGQRLIPVPATKAPKKTSKAKKSNKKESKAKDQKPVEAKTAGRDYDADTEACLAELRIAADKIEQRIAFFLAVNRVLGNAATLENRYKTPVSNELQKPE